MKNLNKKIGAIALAGMVVFGGVAAGGVQVFASEVGFSQQEQQLEKMLNLLMNN